MHRRAQAARHLREAAAIRQVRGTHLAAESHRAGRSELATYGDLGGMLVMPRDARLARAFDQKVAKPGTRGYGIASRMLARPQM